jgi:dihydroorotase
MAEELIFDLVLHGGTLVDPAQGIHARRDVGFAAGKVAAVAPELSPTQSLASVDCSGKLLVPGLIDLHVHVFWGVSHFGIEPDRYCVARGVTTAVDAGSAGGDTFPGFRRFIIEPSATRLFAHLNISSQGMLTREIGELMELEYASVNKALATIEQNRDVLLGVKVRLTKDSIVSQAAGLRPLHLAREAADAAGLPIMVHPQAAWATSLDEILAVMKCGDILTHCFHGAACGVLDETGKVRRSVREAVERGVIFDVGHGAGSFHWGVAEKALEQELVPQTISSDLHKYNIDGPVFDLTTTVSKFLTLGLPLDEALRKVTATPADVIRMPGQIGTLAVGAWGDAVVLELEEGEFPLVDSHGVIRTGRQRIVPTTTVRAGRVYSPPDD